MTLAHHYSGRTASDHHHSPQSDSLSSPPSSPPPDFALFQKLDQVASYPPYLPSALDFSYCGPSDDYIIDSRQSTPYDSTFNHLQDTQHSEDTQYMTHNLSTNPRLRIQQSSPSDGLRSQHTPPPMNEGSNWVQPGWNNYPDQTYLSPQTTQIQYHTQSGFRSHKRLSSDSSVGSTGPSSPYAQTTAYPHIVDSDSQSVSSPQLEAYDSSYPQAQNFVKPFCYSPTSPIGQSYVNPAFQNLNLGNCNAVTGQVGLKQLRDYQNMVNTGAGQRTTRRSFAANNGNMGAPSTLVTSVLPKLDRTVSEAYQDELYDSTVAPSSAQSQQTPLSVSQASLLSPNRSVFSDRVRQANSARSESPSTEMTRERSPFRDDSEYAHQSFPQAPSTAGTSRINSAAQIRQQQKLQADARAYAQHHPEHNNYAIAPKTISPKEALLEYDEDAKSPNVKREPEYSSAHAGQNSFVRRRNTTNAHDINQGSNTTDKNESTSTSSSRRPASDLSSSQQSQQSNQSNYTFMPPSLPNEASQRYPWAASNRRQSSSMRSAQSDQVPEFPSTLPSMESTKSESGQEQNVRPPAFTSQETSSSQRSETTSPMTRPVDTSANSGTYTCVAPDCHARFDSSTKLHRHRREDHRISPQHAASPSTASSSTSPATNTQAVANNVSRNNAPGPHYCVKINPSTGKPCQAKFSRSYDLTRHEDTIHNNRKQKVRCQLCTDEKTFSRNDALTRHMRVVHPDVEFPGRQRRRG